MDTLEHIFDTHSHYDDTRFDGIREEIIASLFERGISGIIHSAIDFNSCEYGINAAKRWERYYTSIGIHPENLYDAVGDYIDRLEKLAENKKVVAIGEIGLDYHYEGFNRKAQTEAFRNQVMLANKLDLPVIVHCRDAIGDCMEILKEFRPKGVMHCYSGSAETAKELLDLGFYISFTGALTFKNSKKAQEVMKMLPLERFMLETDCPYMAPEPFRGKTCDSSMIIYTAQKAAEIKGVEIDEILSVTESNTKSLFKIG